MLREIQATTGIERHDEPNEYLSPLPPPWNLADQNRTCTYVDFASTPLAQSAAVATTPATVLRSPIRDASTWATDPIDLRQPLSSLTTWILNTMHPVDYVDRTLSDPPTPWVDTPEVSTRQEALAAVSNLHRWLALTHDQVAELAGVSPRSLAYWRSRQTNPHRSTIRKLIMMQSLIASLVKSLGLEATHLWIEEVMDDGRTRLAALAEDDGVQKLLAQARGFIFEGREEPPTLLPDDEADSDRVMAPESDAYTARSRQVGRTGAGA